MRNVIIVGVHRGLSEVEPLDIKQEAGRAGRVGYDPKGDAYILLPDNEYSKYKHWCENIPPITSTMNDAGTLAFHIISEIEQKEVNDVKTLMMWYNRSLAAFQNDFLDRIDAEQLLEKLEKIKVIEKKNEKYQITQLGRVAAYQYYNPYTVAGWYFNFNKIIKMDLMNDTALSWALANIQDNNDNYIPKDIADDIKAFIRNCKMYGLDIADGPAVIGYHYYACLTNEEENIDQQKKSAIKYDIDRIIATLMMIDQKCTDWKMNNYWKKLGMRITYEVPENQVELCTLKGIGGVYSRRLFEAGIKTIDEFKNNPRIVVEQLGKKLYEKVMEDNHF